MGCESSNTARPAVIIGPTTIITDFAVIARQVQQTWPDIHRINKLGAKNLRTAYKTEAELLHADEVKEAGDKFISVYSDIIERSDTTFDEVIREKATGLYQQGVRAAQFYGESLVHVIKYELGDQLNLDEKLSWQVFSSRVSNTIASVLTEFPRKSLV